MSDKKKQINRLLSKVSYKKPKDDWSFYIPEIVPEDEMENNDIQSEKGQSSGIENNNTPNIITRNIDSNLQNVKQLFNYPVNKDIRIREFKIAGRIRAFIVYISGMVDRNVINNDILKPLLRERNFGAESHCTIDYILNSVIETSAAEKIASMEEVAYRVLSGETGLYIDNCNFFILSDTRGYEKRAVDKPQVEAVISGAQEAFNEDLKTNMVLIRRNIKNRNLTSEYIRIGATGNKLCAVMYINGLTNPALVEEVKRRLTSIRTDFVLGDGMIEQLIESEGFSLLPTTLNTERPDRTAANLVEGKVAILSDGEPFALIVPITITELFHSPEDMSLRQLSGTLLRFIRIFAVFIAVFLPGMYIAITNFHQEMIPTELLLAIGTARENVPFPTIIEVILMESSFELIREAGVRVPGVLGSTIGIIGALILGQAAVEASLVSPILIIIVAITGLGNFAIPNVSFAYGIRVMRMFFIAAGASLGFYGISTLLVTLTILLSDMKSFGVPFLSGISPRIRRGKDILIRKSVWKQELRPDYLNTLDPRRQPHVSRKWTEEKPKYRHRGGDSSD